MIQIEILLTGQADNLRIKANDIEIVDSEPKSPLLKLQVRLRQQKITVNWNDCYSWDNSISPLWN